MVPLFDIVNDQKQAGGTPFGAEAVCDIGRPCACITKPSGTRVGGKSKKLR
jgi:hypothetical protein